jgi:Protein of unknown function (DUF 659)
MTFQVCTDSASNCRSAGQLVEARFPHVTWSPCGAHVLDLLLEDIGKLAWVHPVIADARKIVTFIRNHQKSLALFRDRS